MKNLYLILIALFLSSQAFAATRKTNSGTYNWTDPLAWVGGIVPGVSDVAQIMSNSNITVNSDVFVGSVKSSNCFNSSLTISSGSTLNINSAATISLSGMFTITNNGTLNTPGATFLIFGPDNTIINNGILNILDEIYVVCISGNLDYINNTGGISNIATANISSSGDPFNFILNGGDVNFEILELNPDSGDPSTISFDLSSGNGTINISEELTSADDYILNGGSLGSTVNFNGTAAQTLEVFPSNQFYNLTISNPVGVTLASVIPAGAITNLLEVTSGSILKQASFPITTAGLNNLGTINANAKFNVGLLDFNNAGIFNQVSDTVVAAQDLFNTGTYNAKGAINVARNFTNGSIFTSTGTNINIEKDWDNSGTYTYSSGDIVSMTGSTFDSELKGKTTFYELNANKSGSVNTAVSLGDTAFVKGFLSIDGGNFNVAGSVTLLSSLTGTGQLAEIASSSNYNGDLTVQRHLAVAANNGWREITSPVAGTTLQDWQNNGVIFTGFTDADYDASNWYGWINSYTYTEANAAGDKENGWVASTNITNETGFAKGHRIYMGDKDENLSVKGAPVQKAQSVAITNGSTGDDEFGWNLIGNPYASTIDWNLIYAKSTNVNNAIWIWSGDAANYGTSTGGIGTSGVSNEIAHSQAFWVYANAATGSVNFDESDKVRSDKAIVKSNSFVENVRSTLR